MLKATNLKQYHDLAIMLMIGNSMIVELDIPVCIKKVFSIIVITNYIVHVIGVYGIDE